MTYRPRYESERDGAAEVRIAHAVAGALRLRAVKAGSAYQQFDGFLVEPDIEPAPIRAIVEIKVRRYDWRLFVRDGYRISAHKWANARLYASSMRVPFILAVCANGDLRTLTLGNQGEWAAARMGPHVMAGRADRGDAMDIEPNAVLRGDLFKPVPGWVNADPT